FAGAKMRMDVPDQRYVPATAGEIVKNAGLPRAAWPSATIGSEKATRTSDASSAEAISPLGPVLTIRSETLEEVGCAVADTAARQRKSANVSCFMGVLRMIPNPDPLDTVRRPMEQRLF